MSDFISSYLCDDFEYILDKYRIHRKGDKVVTHKKAWLYRRVGVLLCVLCALLLCLGRPVKAEVTGNTVVTYEKAESDKYGLTVDVKGDGKVTCGENVIRDGRVKYQLAVDEALTFQLSPDSGASIKTVRLNGETLESAKNTHVLTVEGAEKEQELVVEFSQGIKTTVANVVKTGDSARIGMYVVLIILAVCVVAWLGKNKRNKQEEAKENGEEQNETFSE